MSKVYYSFHQHMNDSVSVHHKTCPDGVEMKKGILRGSKGLAMKSLTTLAGSRTVKWDYEAKEGLLCDPGQIAQYIFEGYKAKESRALSKSLISRLCHRVYRLVCKITHTQTKQEQLAELVSVIQNKTFVIGVTHRVQVKREIERVKARAEQVLEETRELYANFENKLKTHIKDFESGIKHALDRVKELEDIKSRLGEELEELKDKFMDDFGVGLKRGRVSFQMFQCTEDVEEYAKTKWAKHSKKNAEVAALLAEIEETDKQLAAARAAYDLVNAKALSPSERHHHGKHRKSRSKHKPTVELKV